MTRIDGREFCEFVLGLHEIGSILRKSNPPPEGESQMTRIDGIKERESMATEDKIPLDAEALARLAELTGWESVGRAALKTVGQQDVKIKDLLKGMEAARPVMEKISLYPCLTTEELAQEGSCGACASCQARAWKKEYYPEEKS